MDIKEFVEKLQRAAWHARRWEEVGDSPTDADREIIAAGLPLAEELAPELAAVLCALIDAHVLDIIVTDGKNTHGFFKPEWHGAHGPGYHALRHMLLVDLRKPSTPR